MKEDWHRKYAPTAGRHKATTKDRLSIIQTEGPIYHFSSNHFSTILHKFFEKDVFTTNNQTTLIASQSTEKD